MVVIIPLSQTQDDLGDPDNQFQDPDAYSPDFCKQEFTTPLAYITAEFGQGLFPESGVFVVGAEGTEDPGPYSPNDRQQRYTNGLLCYNKQYTFFVRAYLELDSQVRSLDMMPTRNYEGWVALLIDVLTVCFGVVGLGDLSDRLQRDSTQSSAPLRTSQPRS